MIPYWSFQYLLKLKQSFKMKGKKSWDVQCSRWVNISQASASMNSADLISNRRRQWQPTPVLLPGKSHEWRSLVGCSPWGREESDTTEWLHFHFSLHASEKEMAPHSSVLAWRIPGTGEPGRLLPMGSHRVGHDWSDLAAAAASIIWANAGDE